MMERLNRGLSVIIGEALESFLTGPDLDLQVVQMGDDPCDAVLTVVLTATPLGANYVPTWYTPSPDDLLGLATAQQRCYNGAAVEGQMSLALPGRASAQVPISGKKSPPSEIGGCLAKDQAPFGKAWPRAVLNGLAHFWGSEVYVQAVAHPGQDRLEHSLRLDRFRQVVERFPGEEGPRLAGVGDHAVDVDVDDRPPADEYRLLGDQCSQPFS